MLNSTLEIIRGADDAMFNGARAINVTLGKVGDNSEYKQRLRSELTTWAKTHGVGYEFYTIDEFGNGLVEKVHFEF